MNRALFLLIGLQLRGLGRRMVRSFRTLKGALFIGLGLFIFLPYLITLLYVPQDVARATPETIRRFFPLMLLLYCFSSLALSRGEGGLTFTPSEVCFLFTGPFSRRQLLSYKLLYNLLLSLPTTLLLSLFLYPHGKWYPAVLAGLFLSMFFLQQFLMALYLTAQTVGLKTFTIARKMIVLVMIAAAVAAVGQVFLHAPPATWGDFARALEESAVWHVVRVPLLWFADTFLADNWTDLVVNGGLALAVNLGLVLLIFLLDAQYLEAAATRSELVHQQMQRIRRGEAISMHFGTSRFQTRTKLPLFPRLGGIGPIVWRQVLTAVRSLGRLALIGFVMTPVLVGPLFSLTHTPDEMGAATGIFGGMILWLSLIVSTMLPFDFRGDVDRMEVLKTLPLPAWRIVVGQVCVPVVLLSFIQLLLVVVLQIFMRPDNWILLAIGAFVVPFNALVFTLDNLLFLCFPGRMLATPGDFETMGRNVLFMLTKMFTLGMTGAVAGLLMALVYWLTGESWAATLATGWCVLAGMTAVFVPLAAWAFERFDVARDVPAE